MKVYFDNHATTPIAPTVRKAIDEEMGALPGNPSSIHSLGKEAKKRLNRAREEVASHFKVTPGQVVFTSGATEAIYTLLHDVKGGSILTTEIEHSAIYKGISNPIYIPVGPLGAPDPLIASSLIRPDTAAIFLSAASNETGVKLDIAAFAKLAEERKIPLFLDAVAFVGKEDPSPLLLPGVSAFFFAPHKFHGPPGVGAIIFPSTYRPSPLFKGGSQEFSLRSGTENLPAIVGLAKALELISPIDAVKAHLALLQTRLEEKLPEAIINGEGERIKSVSNLYFPSIEGEMLLIALDQHGICASLGSACQAGLLEPSRPLLKMGYSKERAMRSIRFSFSLQNTAEEIDYLYLVLTKNCFTPRKAGSITVNS